MCFASRTLNFELVFRLRVNFVMLPFTHVKIDSKKSKIKTRPTADEVINGDEVKTVINTGKSVEDNGNRFIGHGTTDASYKQIRKSIVEVTRKEGI